MNTFALLRSFDGTEHTIPEILQQPHTWLRLTEAPDLFWNSLDRFLSEAASGPIILTGAGSSAYIGQALLPTLAAWTGRPVLAFATTDLVTHAADLVPPGEGLCISFGRSGNSPESLAAVERLQVLRPGYRHISITCNADGALARAMTGPRRFSFPMPAETHDASLVMTSSFTAMYLAGLRIGAARHSDWVSEVQTLAVLSETFIENFAPVVTSMTPQRSQRVQFLGSGPQAGAAREMRLKMLEMSDGRVTAHDETFLGLRHGPQVFVQRDTLVVAVVSADPLVAPYEKDLLKELVIKGQGEFLVFVPVGISRGDLPSAAKLVTLPSPGGKTSLSRRCPDAFMVPVAVIGGQMLATVACLGLGHKPDAPSASGTISRVVQGVHIHPFQEVVS